MEILYKRGSAGIRGSVLSALIQFLSNRSQHVLVDSCHRYLVSVVFVVPQGSVLGPLLSLLYTSVLFSILENKLIGYADYSTLMAVVPSPGVTVTCSHAQCTMHSQSPLFTIGGTVLKESVDLDILGVTFD